MACQEQRVSGLNSAPLSDFSAPACANGYGPLCECGAEEQIVDHVVLHCPIHRLFQRMAWIGADDLDDETIEWLLNTCPEM